MAYQPKASTDSVLGVSSFDTYDFTVTNGAVTERPGSAVYFVGKWGNDSADGLTYSSAKLTLQAAVTVAPANSTILLYPGTYTETVTHANSGVMVKGMGFRTNIIITQADAAAVINIGAARNIIYQDVTISETAATANNRVTVQASTGTAEFLQCALIMICSANIANARQPGVAEITAAGTITLRRGTVEYLHSGNGGATAVKTALRVGTGSYFNMSDVRQVTVNCSGTALMTTMCFDDSTTGYFDVRGCNINVADANATSVIGFAYVSNVAITHEYFKNVLIVTGSGANTAYGITAADTGSTTRLAHNRINVTGGANNYSYNIGAAATVVSQFDVVVAASGRTGVGTLVCDYSPSNGTHTISAGLILTPSTDRGLLVGRGASAVEYCAAATNGQIPIGSTGANPVIATLTAGAGISVTNGAGSVSLAAVGGGYTWNIIIDAAANLVKANGYIANRGTLVTLTLPAATLGDSFKIINVGAGFVRIAQNASDQIRFGNVLTTAGVGGYIQATALGDAVEIVCQAANTFLVLNSVGNWTVV